MSKEVKGVTAAYIERLKLIYISKLIVCTVVQLVL